MTAMMLSLIGLASRVSVVPAFQATDLISPETTSTKTGWRIPVFFNESVA